MVKFAATTTQRKRMPSPRLSPTRRICCGKNRNNSADRLRSAGLLFAADHPQVIAIFALWKFVDCLLQVGLFDKLHSQRDLLQAGNFQALSMLDCGDVIAGLQQTGCRSRIQPGHAATEQFHMERVRSEENTSELQSRFG